MDQSRSSVCRLPNCSHFPLPFSRTCFLFSHIRGPERFLLSRTVNRSRRRGKTQGIENPAQESHYNKKLLEVACFARIGKILDKFLLCKFIKLQKRNSTNIFPVLSSRWFNKLFIILALHLCIDYCRGVKYNTKRACLAIAPFLFVVLTLMLSFRRYPPTPLCKNGCIFSFLISFGQSDNLNQLISI